MTLITKLKKIDGGSNWRRTSVCRAYILKRYKCPVLLNARTLHCDNQFVVVGSGKWICSIISAHNLGAYISPSANRTFMLSFKAQCLVEYTIFGPNSAANGVVTLALSLSAATQMGPATGNTNHPIK